MCIEDIMGLCSTPCPQGKLYRLNGCVSKVSVLSDCLSDLSVCLFCANTVIEWYRPIAHHEVEKKQSALRYVRIETAIALACSFLINLFIVSVFAKVCISLMWCCYTCACSS